MAAVTSGIEGIRPILPADRLVLDGAAGKVTNTAGGSVEPLLLADIVSHGQGLEASPLHGREEIIDILSAQNMFDLVFLIPFRPSFMHPTCIPADLNTVMIVPDRDFILLERELHSAKLSGKRLHGSAMA